MFLELSGIWHEQSKVHDIIVPSRWTGEHISGTQAITPATKNTQWTERCYKVEPLFPPHDGDRGWSPPPQDWRLRHPGCPMVVQEVVSHVATSCGCLEPTGTQDAALSWALSRWLFFRGAELRWASCETSVTEGLLESWTRALGFPYSVCINQYLHGAPCYSQCGIWQLMQPGLGNVHIRPRIHGSKCMTIEHAIYFASVYSNLLKLKYQQKIRGGCA